ncbi:U6 snRNA-associated Sm-like protein LSm8 [Candida albicans P76067]|nr:U6 snRNA-associated Sm-like protein LSm8 [Candida albicans P76055]KHC33548.1 U6 snRNA-associated Sm-like protein LSm8 [Candida albicans P76067]
MINKCGREKFEEIEKVSPKQKKIKTKTHSIKNYHQPLNTHISVIMSELSSFLEKKVHVITSDARFFEGILEGYDKSTNIILSNCIERIIYSKDDEEGENQEIPLGVYIMRGNEIVCVGEIDDELYKSINWETLKGHALKSTKNPLK